MANILVFAFSVGVSAAADAVTAPSEKPSFLFILGDDIGWVRSIYSAEECIVLPLEFLLRISNVQL
jgi:hypothetical protein